MPHTTLHRILYVEDDEALARLLQKRMERQRFVVDIALSAEEGLERIGAEAYDLVLVDYHLPGMNGLEMLEAMSGFSAAPPVIMLTSSGDERVAVAALENGAVDYAVKDTGNTYLDLLPAIMQAAHTKQSLLQENERQRRELEFSKEKAEAASQAKTNFLTTMSHEIRTPLNVVTGLASLLAKTTLDAQQTKMVKTLIANADLLLKLINDLLDISRIEDGHVILEAVSFELPSILRSIQEAFEAQASAKKLELRVTDRTAGKRFIGDRTRVQQILMNLVSNALKFTETGSIDITTEMVERAGGAPCIKLTVRDTGIGIAPEKIPTIFDKFTQADETITRRYGGSGLGLCIVSSLVKLMDGEITVESVPGKGSVFTAIMCLSHCDGSQDGECSLPNAPQAESPIPGGGIILLVEDYFPNVMVATYMLEDLGFQVIAVENGAEAIRIVSARSEPFTAILMDVQMQDMDGLETTRRIREAEQGKGFRHTIIGVTAHALAGDRERCISAGMDDYISKPIHPDILAAKLRSLSKAMP